jgi:hypothetical protein
VEVEVIDAGAMLVGTSCFNAALANLPRLPFSALFFARLAIFMPVLHVNLSFLMCLFIASKLNNISIV